MAKTKPVIIKVRGHIYVVPASLATPARKAWIKKNAPAAPKKRKVVKLGAGARAASLAAAQPIYSRIVINVVGRPANVVFPNGSIVCKTEYFDSDNNSQGETSQESGGEFSGSVIGGLVGTFRLTVNGTPQGQITNGASFGNFFDSTVPNSEYQLTAI